VSRGKGKKKEVNNDRPPRRRKKKRKRRSFRESVLFAVVRLGPPLEEGGEGGGITGSRTCESEKKNTELAGVRGSLLRAAEGGKKKKQKPPHYALRRRKPVQHLPCLDLAREEKFVGGRKKEKKDNGLTPLLSCHGEKGKSPFTRLLQGKKKKKEIVGHLSRPGQKRERNRAGSFG